MFSWCSEFIYLYFSIFRNQSLWKKCIYKWFFLVMLTLKLKLILWNFQLYVFCSKCILPEKLLQTKPGVHPHSWQLSRRCRFRWLVGERRLVMSKSVTHSSRLGIRTKNSNTLVNGTWTGPVVWQELRCDWSFGWLLFTDANVVINYNLNIVNVQSNCD